MPHDKKRQYEMEMIRELRAMNVSTEVLFPDLAGFADSLAQQLAYVDIF